MKILEIGKDINRLEEVIQYLNNLKINEEVSLLSKQKELNLQISSNSNLALVYFLDIERLNILKKGEDYYWIFHSDPLSAHREKSERYGIHPIGNGNWHEDILEKSGNTHKTVSLKLKNFGKNAKLHLYHHW